MVPDVLMIASYVAVVLAACGCGYYVVCVWSARAFRKSRAEIGRFTPPVSILKPLRGADREMYECLRTHFLQDYPEYEVIFGVSEADDPAIQLVGRLKCEFPDRQIKVVFCREKLGTNVKVSNLVQMLPHARHEYLLVNDSDIRVGPDYLRRVIAPLASKPVGLVTALYRGEPARTFGSRLEALGISTDFAAGVLTARLVEGGIHFGLGSTLAFKREALVAIGGFAPLLDYLADDYELGFRIGKAEYQLVLAREVVDTFLPAYDFVGYWQHQLRWMRTIRCSRPGGYAGLLFTFGLPFGILAAVLSRGAAWSWVLLLVALATRFAMAYEVAIRALGQRSQLRDFGLIPIRDVLALVTWIGGYFGRTIMWRGERFRLKRGKLTI